MSSRTLPLLFINLGGEMLYILDQRLRAQNIPADKAKKVMNDIITTMFNKKFLEELFKPQELYSKKALRTVFDRLAHASIMRLNQASMDKLYDLMTMAFKYQVLLCPRPKDILLVSFNHMDAIKDFVKDTPSILSQVDETYRQLIEMYTPLSSGEFQLIRQTLLIFFQDMHIRVSIFLKDKVQNSNGRFVLPTSGPVPHGTQVPGLIRYHSKELLSLRPRQRRVSVHMYQIEALISRPDELSYGVINIQATKDQQANAELAKIMGEFTESGDQSPSVSNKGDDLLAMMDGL
ncbi:protein OSCP1 [Pundamilia nyererei]|uniref:Protein OSCP1 n=1 Tax=Pundamilia nyererei TaxID=303518 RepID=A0A9Y3R9P4_9CICH|nr:PREDICTED: protein OSCP1 [Pundamilia nyererei]